MDEFDKIREISEDLTHRREPTFESFSSVSSDSSLKSTAATRPAPEQNDSPLKSALTDLQAEGNVPFTSPFADDAELDNSLEEKKFPSMKIHLIGLTLFAGILAVVLAGFFIFNAEPEDMSEVVTITAEPVVVKELPEQAGGINIPDQDKLVYNRIRSDNVTTKVESLFPEPEKPVMPQILSIEDNTPEQKFVDMNAVKPVNPLEAAEKAEKTAAGKAAEAAPQIKAKEAVPTPAVEIQKPLEPLSQPVEKASVETPKIEPVQIPQQSVASAKSAEKSAVQPAQGQNSATRSTPGKEEQTQKAAGEKWRIQLFASNNKAAVEKAWNKIQAAQKNFLSGLSHEIEAASISGKGKFYRLKVGAFATREAAAGLCAKLKARKQDCMPVK